MKYFPLCCWLYCTKLHLSREIQCCSRNIASTCLQQPCSTGKSWCAKWVKEKQSNKETHRTGLEAEQHPRKVREDGSGAMHCAAEVSPGRAALRSPAFGMRALGCAHPSPPSGAEIGCRGVSPCLARGKLETRQAHMHAARWMAALSGSQRRPFPRFVGAALSVGALFLNETCKIGLCGAGRNGFWWFLTSGCLLLQSWPDVIYLFSSLQVSLFLVYALCVFCGWLMFFVGCFSALLTL